MLSFKLLFFVFQQDSSNRERCLRLLQCLLCSKMSCDPAKNFSLKTLVSVSAHIKLDSTSIEVLIVYLLFIALALKY